MSTVTPVLNPKLDLVLERVIDVPPELVWKAWTQPEHLKKWFTPVPWQTVHCEIDLRPGGRFHTVMRSPEGQEFPGDSCYLEVVENKRLVWTTALAPGFRPVKPEEGAFHFTAIIALEKHGNGTKYMAIAMHMDEDGCRKHAEMGFHDGWGKALDQLVDAMKRL